MAATISERPKSSMPTVRASRNPFTAMREEMNDLIARMWDGYEAMPALHQIIPALDVSETENAYKICVDSPGMSSGDFDIQVHGNTITINGHRKEEKEEKEAVFHRVERRTGQFSRTLTLPTDVNEDEVAAEYTNGVLAVLLPKSEKCIPRKIQVKS